MTFLVLGAMLVAAMVPAADALQITTAARSVQPGELVLISAHSAEPLDTLRVRAFGREVAGFRVEPQLWQALVGIDVDVKPGPQTLAFTGTSAGRAVHATLTLVVKARAFRRRVLHVDDAFVNPPETVLTRIAEEAAELDRFWSASAPSRLWDEGFRRPVPGVANGAFGMRSIFNGQPRQRHGGADFLSPAGTPVVAPSSGRVVLARELYFTGNTVVIDHGLGLVSLLAHLSRIDVQAGAAVAGGATIGLVGATGRVTGPHLHWAVRVGHARVDPLSVLALLPAPNAGSNEPATANAKP